MSTSVREAPTLAFRCSDREFAEDGYRIFERVREEGPAVFSPGFEHNSFRGDAYLMTHYRPTARVMGDARKFRQPPELFERLFGDVVFEGIDDKERHDEIRGVWGREFERHTLREKRLRIIERVVADHVDPFVERVEAGETRDAMAELHQQIPITVMLSMLDLPMPDRDKLREWAEQVSGIEKMSGTGELNAYIGEILVERKRSRGNDLISMMAASRAAERMTDSEIIANATQLVFAGAGTTTSLMTSCVVLLAQHPDQRRLVAADRSLVPRAIEEVMRLHGPGVFAAPRIVCDGDATVDGVRVPEGATLMPIVTACNRDPLRWERPREFDLLRESKQHLGFGFGMHVCLGLNLARLETETYLNLLLDGLPDWELVTDVDFSSSPFTGTVIEPIRSLPIAASA
jgi:cytochrome P450